MSLSRWILRLGILPFVMVASLAQGETLQEFFKEFDRNPARMMQRLPSLVDKNGVATPRGFIDEKEVAERLPSRTKAREEIMKNSAPLSPMAVPGGADQLDAPELLTEPGVPIVKNLLEMQNRGLMNISVPVIPWSDSYWPKYKGLIGNRYADSAFPDSKSFMTNYAYAQNNPASSIVASRNPALIDTLSPSEKYDFVMGDPNFTLTRYAWNQGKKDVEDGGLGSWEGICNGWSGAAHMLSPFNDRPLVVQATNGTPVTFYPQDMKALLSMLWAKAPVHSRFVGSKCVVSSPEKNAYGRILNPKCFDPNPATWHIGVANQLGLNRRSFVIDATYDFQVWNHPLISARTRYFNLETRQEADSLQAAAVPVARLRFDYFKEFRPANAKSIVGIMMDITYVTEIEPKHSRVYETPTKTLRLIYDLELDDAYNILGGEWYSNAHPDFLWTYDANAQAMAREDVSLMSDPWNNSGPVPSAWSPLAQQASARGTPLYSFIKKTLDAAGYTRYVGPPR